MSKWYGAIGFSETVETSPGIWTETVVEKFFYGDVVRNTRSLNAPEKVNDDITINNSISILADPYALNNFHSIRYLKFMGTAWKVNSAEVQFPRILLTLGGVYNGEQAGIA